MTDSSSAPGQQPPPRFDTNVPQSARIWNYWLGGKDNYPVDRAAGDQYRQVFPGIVDVARASRQFVTRAVRYLTGEAQIARWPERIAAPGPPQNRTCDVNRIRLKQAPRDSRVVVPVTAGLRCRVGVGSGCG